MKILYSIMVILSLLFLFTNHPLILSLILVMQTMTILLFTGMLSQSFWFSYILFLVMIGGVLILFIYIMSLIFNKMISQKFDYKMMIVSFLITMISLLMFKTTIINNMDMNINYLLYPEMINLIKLYNFPMNLINILMINYLLFLLIVMVKITNFSYSPMRMKI